MVPKPCRSAGKIPGDIPEHFQKSAKSVSENTPIRSREDLSMVPKPPGKNPGHGPKKSEKNVEKNDPEVTPK